MFYIRTWKCEMKIKVRFFSWKCSETLRGIIFECVVSRNSFHSKWHLIRCIKICLWVLFSIVNLHYSHCVELGRRQSDFIRSRLITFEGILFVIISCSNFREKLKVEMPKGNRMIWAFLYTNYLKCSYNVTSQNLKTQCFY